MRNSNPNLPQLLLLVQLIATAQELKPVTRFESATSRLRSCVLIAATACVAWFGDHGHGHQYSNRVFVTSVLAGAQIIAVLVLMAAIFAVKRHPTVFRQDTKVVDREMGANLWSRYSFQWCIETLTASSKDKFGSADLPALNHRIRSEITTASFKNMSLNREKIPLWLQIIWQFRGVLTWQWVMILISNFFDVAPAFATLQLLQYLESRKDIDDRDPMAWKYVLYIVVATASSHFIDSRIGWSRSTGLSLLWIYWYDANIWHS